MRSGLIWIVLAACLAACGCQKVVLFPERSMGSVAKAFGAVGAYDTNRDGLADYFTFADSSGRITRIAYDANGTGRPGEFIDLDALAFDRCRHLAVILDGLGYEVVKEYCDSGGLRLFHAPSKVIAPYPSMTDPAIDDLLGAGPCPGCEAVYFDRARNRVVGGSADYLAAKNMPYNRLLDYRASVLDDALHYLWPRSLYRGEIDKLKQAFDRSKKREFLAYLVSSAGMGTRLGKEGQLECLRQLDRLLMQILWETRGAVKFTLLADHGHSYTPATRIPLEKALEAKGWRISDRLEKPNDVVYIRFGLETCAVFYTNSPAGLAEDLGRVEGVELASYAQSVPPLNPSTGLPAPSTEPAKDRGWERAVVVLGGKAGPGDPNGMGMGAIQRTDDSTYKYDFIGEDPLRIQGLPGLKPTDHGGLFDANAMFAATLESYYPASLERLWRAHLGHQVEHPPDVIVSLEDRFYSGSESLGSMVDIASTHGGLNRRNSTAFIMSSAGPLPSSMRSREVPANMEKMTGRTWPAGSEK